MSKMNLKTQAYNTIRQKIVTCEYAPGTFLNEELLTTELGLSRTPVRDALSRLEQEGLIEIKPKKGIIVMPLSINTINMIFEVRQLYEPYILLNYGNALSVERLKDFYNIFSSSKTNHNCYNNNDYFYELDTEFHNFVVDACPNTYIHQNYNMIQTQAERFRYMTGNISEKRLDENFQNILTLSGHACATTGKKLPNRCQHILRNQKRQPSSLFLAVLLRNHSRYRQRSAFFIATLPISSSDNSTISIIS